MYDFLFLKESFPTDYPWIFTPHSVFPHQSFPYPSWLSVNITFQRMIWSPHFPHTIHPVWMWELDCEESWALKNWCFWTVVLEKTWESLGLQGDPTIPSKGNQSWIFTGRTDAEAETPILWPPDAKNWLIWKDPDAGKDWRWEEKRQQGMRWLDGITDLMRMSLSKFW